MNGDQHGDQQSHVEGARVGQADTPTPAPFGPPLRSTLPPAAHRPVSPAAAQPIHPAAPTQQQPHTVERQPLPQPQAPAAAPVATPPVAEVAEAPADPTPLVTAAPVEQPAQSDLNGELVWESTANIQAWSGQQAAAMVAGAVALTVGVFFLTRDIFSTVAVAISALLLIYVGQRRPQAIRYRANGKGIIVGDKFYSFHGFRSFAIEQPSGPDTNGIIQLTPLRRFMPMLTVTYSRQVENRLIDLLETHLPFEHHRKDAVDSLLGKLRIG